MVDIKSIESLRPELQEVSDKELERRMTELQMEVDRRKAEADRKAKAEENELKNVVIANFVSVLREMHDFNLLPAEVEAFYTSKSGIFAPHLRHKQLRP